VVCSGSGRRFAQIRRQSSEIFLAVEQHQLRLLLLEDVLPEFGVQPGQLLIELGEASFRYVVELGAGADEVRVAQPEQALLLRSESELIPRRVDRGDAREELAVLNDPIAEGSELGLHLGLDRLDFGVVHRPGVDRVDRRHPVQCVAGALHRRDGVLEGGGRGVGGDAIDLGEVFVHCRLERRLDVGDLESPERGNPAPRPRPGGKQRVFGVRPVGSHFGVRLGWFRRAGP